MHMSFWWSADVGPYLFQGLLVKTVPALVSSCCVVGCFSFLFEYLRYIQARQRQKELFLRAQQLKTICPSESSTLLTETAQRANPLNITLCDRAIILITELTLWFSLQNIGYFLMLSVMLFNGWLFLAAVVGGGLGYFVFGQLFMKINLQNCQIMRDTFCTPKCSEPEANASQRDGESTPALETSTTSQGSLSCHNKVIVSVHAEDEILDER